jgi:putative ABC transport system substrate-binding protein
MKRREFIAAAAALLGSTGRSRAQGSRPRRLGYLGAFQNLRILNVFHEGLREHGWIEGKNLIVDYRFFEGHAERIPVLAAELVGFKPDLLIGSQNRRLSQLKQSNSQAKIG